jgi:hypothetical protein
MPILAITAFLFGAFLGLRFKVLILLPAAGLGIVGVLVGGLILRESPVTLSWAIGFFIFAIQVGYLAGLFVGYQLFPIPARRPYPDGRRYGDDWHSVAQSNR